MRKFLLHFQHEFYKAGMVVLFVLFFYVLALLAGFLYVLTHY